MTEDDDAEILAIVDQLQAVFTGRSAYLCVCSMVELLAKAAVNHSQNPAEAEAAMATVHRDLDKFLDMEAARRWQTRH
jgi:hypothetical protein